MCRVFHSSQPVCRCVKIGADVVLCSLYTGLPKNRDKLKFNVKLVTGHSKGLDQLFNGVDYVSADQAPDKTPKGLDCEEIELLETPSKRGLCPLCDNPEVLKFLNAKGVAYDPVANIAFEDGQDKAAEGSAKDAGESSRGRPLKASRGKSLDKLASSSDEMEGVEYNASQAREREMEGVEYNASQAREREGPRAEGKRAEGKRAEGKRAVSEPDESKIASMDWE